jgi:proline dehydrogenase
MMRSALLWASTNKRMERLVRSTGATRRLVNRFMPGETREEVMRAVRRLAKEDTPAIVTYLGENVTTDESAEESVAEYERLLDDFATERAHSGVNAHISVKLTQFGWDFDRARALDRVRRLAKSAAEAASMLVIDMESSPYVEATIEAYEQLATGSRNVGLCLQAYLHRTRSDLRRLLPLKPYIRLVKGAYREHRNVTLQQRGSIDERYHSLARDLLAATKRGARVAFGTHDMRLISRIRQTARDYGVPESDFEIQMLYGIQDAGRRHLAANGAQTRVLISYGSAWYPWFMRRLAEKPSNLLLVGRNLF